MCTKNLLTSSNFKSAARDISWWVDQLYNLLHSMGIWIPVQNDYHSVLCSYLWAVEAYNTACIGLLCHYTELEVCTINNLIFKLNRSVLLLINVFWLSVIKYLVYDYCIYALSTSQPGRPTFYSGSACLKGTCAFGKCLVCSL